MIAVLLATLALMLFGVVVDHRAFLIAFAIGGVADVIRANRPKDWSLAQRVDALSEAYAKGYKDARDELS